MGRLFTGTATATLIDLAPPEGRRRATLVATAANIGGLGLGPLVCGLLAEYAPNPLQLVFIVDLCLVAIAAVLVFAIPETVEVKPGARLRLQRLGVPAEVRSIFIRASLAAFAGFAILGLFTAVAPAFLAQVLGETSHAVLGIVVAAAFESSLLGQIAVERVGEERSLPLGCAFMILGMGLLIGGLEAESLALIVLGGVCAGIGQGLSFRAGLAAINRDAPPERRAETVSSYFVVAYTALAVPVIGVGIAADAWQLRGAGVAFAAIMATLAATVLISLRDQLRPAAARG